MEEVKAKKTTKATKPEVAPAPVTPASASKKVATTVGEMVHPFTHAKFDTYGVEHALDSFVQSQLDAGKLVLI